jgi:hypothetical protein
MDTIKKKNYVAPETFSVKMVSGSLICGSEEPQSFSGERSNYGEAQPYTW